MIMTMDLTAGACREGLSGGYRLVTVHGDAGGPGTDLKPIR